jgi:hypothetical protein
MIRRSAGVAAILSALAVCLTGAASASSSPMTDRLVPAAASGFVLSAVSCGSRSSCIATGSYITSANADVTLAEHWNGRHWGVQHTPNPAGGPGSSLLGVSCWSATSCTAVGNAGNNTDTEVTLAEHWNGRHWSVQRTPDPAGAPSSFLYGVSCTSASACMAVGGYNNSGGTVSFTLAERWNGRRWTIQRPVTPAGSSAGLRGVSCTSAKACTAVGSENSGTLDQALAEHWNGRSWRVQHTPNPASPQNVLNSVSCSSARACMATGSQGTSAFSIGLAMHWSGAKWAVQPSAAPAGAYSVQLPAVACWSATACMAVGEYFIGSDIAQALSVLRIPGTGWSIQHAPRGTAIDSELNGVSCSSPQVCTAVGNYSSGRLLAWRWHGGNDGTWTVEQVPHP